MLAWTPEDADAACYVADTLEAFSLPQVKVETILTKTVRVPAMWQVGIGSSNSVKFDQLWSVSNLNYVFLLVLLLIRWDSMMRMVYLIANLL